MPRPQIKMPRISPQVRAIMRTQSLAGKPVTKAVASGMNKTNMAAKKGQLGKGWK